MIPFDRLRRNKKGVTGLVIALVVSLVALSAMIPIGLLITAKVEDTVDDYVLGVAGNATRDALFANIFAAYDLAAIVPIVAAAGIIISVIVAAFYFKTKTS